MREIGGYFGLEAFCNKEYHSDLIDVNSGRNALLYILRVKAIQKIYIPYFLCDSIAFLCDREKISYQYYNIDKDFLPIFDKQLGDNEFIYIVNYYGQLAKSRIIGLKQKYRNIILDNVQAFFEKPIENIDTIYSCRKFFGVSDGGYVSTNTRLKESLMQDISKDRMSHILGRLEYGASEYYGQSLENEKLFYNLELKRMSKLTHNILGCVDYDAVKNKRERNFEFMHNELGKENRLNIHLPVGPYSYPFYCENGIEIKKELSKKGIYIATLWPNVLEMDNCRLEKELAANILPLPIDQRYDEEDLKYLVGECRKCMKI